MRKAKKVVNMTSEPVLVAMALRVLTRMAKEKKHSLADQRLFLRTLARLADAMESTCIK